MDKIKILDVILRPAHDFLLALDSCIQVSPLLHLIIIFIISLISWWIYVPVHEIFHAFGCIVGGGEVSRLDLSPVYGAVFLKRFFPFISVGSEYAGQLTGFNTFGNDFTYLLTDFTPFVLTVVIGLPLLISVSERSSSLVRSLTFGAAIPFAFAPFISITGDYYEMGSVIVSKAASLLFPGISFQFWRSDDVLKLVMNLLKSHLMAPRDICGMSLSFLVGALLIMATYWSGIVFAGFLNRKRKSA